MFRLAENPRRAHGGAANHRASDSGFMASFRNGGGAGEGAVSVDRATEIEIDKIRNHPINDLARGCGHVLDIGAEKLDADWPFNFIKIEVFARPLIPSENPFGGNEFSDQYIRAVFFAQLAENSVGHAGHWREIKRKAIGEPG